MESSIQEVFSYLVAFFGVETILCIGAKRRIFQKKSSGQKKLVEVLFWSHAFLILVFSVFEWKEKFVGCLGQHF